MAAFTVWPRTTPRWQWFIPRKSCPWVCGSLAALWGPAGRGWVWTRCAPPPVSLILGPSLRGQELSGRTHLMTDGRNPRGFCKNIWWERWCLGSRKGPESETAWGPWPAALGGGVGLLRGQGYTEKLGKPLFSKYLVNRLYLSKVNNIHFHTLRSDPWNKPW